jgi:glycosyltransferase involved in cell wall biosynthesis
VRDLDLDCIVYQWRDHFLKDQYEILTSAQRRLPRIYIEHDPPQQHPTFTQHPIQDAATLLVHVTPFNALMWNSGRTPSCVIEHGVRVPSHVRCTGEYDKGIVVVNHLERRGRRLGSDVFHQVKQAVPLDLIGMAAEESGGLGEVLLKDLPEFESRYRFFFNPIRYTSLGLAVCEAMMIGLPIIALATTEMPCVIQNGVSGFVDTRIEVLIDHMKRLLSDRGEALSLGRGARQYAEQRFHIDRFVRDWLKAFKQVTGFESPSFKRAEALC